MRCFQTPSSQAVALLESLLAQEADECMRQCVHILHTANAILEEEGRQLAEIFLQQGKTLVCKAGCAGCCHQLVLCQPFETENILTYLAAHPQKLHAFQAAYPLWDKATASMRQSYLTWAVSLYSQGKDDGSHAFLDYQAPCPFLNAANQCTIYPVRPYGCRSCVALDPACTEPAVGKSGKLHLQYSLYTSHHDTRMSITHVLLRALGMKPVHIPMPEILAAHYKFLPRN